MVARAAGVRGREVRGERRILAGEFFVKTLRALHQAYGDALGINKAAPTPVPVILTEPLRALADAIGGYALQLLAVARHDPDKREAVLLALSPIDDFRASTGRRVVADDDEGEDEEQDEPIDHSADEDDVVAPIPAPTVVVPLAPVA